MALGRTFFSSYFSNLYLVFQYLASFFSPLFLVVVPLFFLSLELISLFSIISFFGQGSTVVVFIYLFIYCFLLFGVEVLIVHLMFSLSHLQQQSLKMDFHYS